VDTALGELRELGARLVAGTWWRSCAGPSTCVVAARVGTHSSSARSADGAVEVRLAAGQLTPATLAHELAHALAGVAHGHDATFRAAHVDIVAMLAGGALGGALADAYAGLGVPAGRRCWPSPVRVTGSGFAVVP
jgi:hypothetical protein